MKTDLTRIIPAAVIGTVTGLAQAGSNLIEHNAIGLPTAGCVACFVGTACFWLSRQFAKRDQVRAEREMVLANTLAEHNRTVGERLSSIEQALRDLPCKGSRPKEPGCST